MFARHGWLTTRELQQKLVDLTEGYHKRVVAEESKSLEELDVENVGKLDPKKHLGQSVQQLMSDNIDKCLVTMLDTVVF